MARARIDCDMQAHIRNVRRKLAVDEATAFLRDPANHDSFHSDEWADAAVEEMAVRSDLLKLPQVH